jgi:hypothetical protein
MKNFCVSLRVLFMFVLFFGSSVFAQEQSTFQSTESDDTVIEIQNGSFVTRIKISDLIDPETEFGNLAGAIVAGIQKKVDSTFACNMYFTVFPDPKMSEKTGKPKRLLQIGFSPRGFSPWITSNAPILPKDLSKKEQIGDVEDVLSRMNISCSESK